MRMIIISPRRSGNAPLFWALFGWVGLLCLLAALCLGEPHVSPLTALKTLAGESDSSLQIALRDVRLPRALLGFLAGAALGLAGLLLQEITHNPIAGPEILGVSSGAALVAATIVVFGLEVSLVWQPALGLVGALLAGAVVLNSMSRHPRPDQVALIGASVSAALAGLVVAVVGLGTQGNVVLLLRYLLGSLAGRGWSHLFAILVPLAAAAFVAWLIRHQVETLGLGEEAAAGLGLKVRRTRLLAVAAATVLAASVASVCGPIAFVALLAPHLARQLRGTTSTGRIFGPAAAIGGLLLVSADLASRLVLYPVEVPVGIATTLVGVPLLVVLTAKGPARS